MKSVSTDDAGPVREQIRVQAAQLTSSLNRELSPQALREQMINLHPPKHLKRPLDVMRWYMTELMKFESQVAKKYPELKVHEQETILES